MNEKFDDEDTECCSENPSWRLPTRYIIGIMGATAVIMNYWIKVSLSVAIVAMVKSHPENSTSSHYEQSIDVCPGGDLTSQSESATSGDFDWNESLQGVILSSYYYGYVATQFLGSILSQKFGGKYIVGPGVVLSGIFIMLSPVAAKYDVTAFIATRVLQGLSSGLIFSGLNPMFSNWFVPDEKQTMFSLIFSSSSLGSVIAMGISGILSSYSWELAFYVPGAATIVWFLIWILTVYSDPSQHPRISEQEKIFIISRTGKYVSENENKNIKTPYLEILTSPPVWVFYSAAVGTCYLTYTFLSELPTYMSNVLHYNIQNSGFISSLPLLSSWISSLCCSFTSQWLQRKRYLSKLNTYRIFNALALVGPAICLLAINLIGCDTNAIVVLLMLTMALNGAYYGGGASNHMDLTNNFVGFVAGVNLTLLNSTAIIAPLVTGALTNHNQTLTQWRLVFYIAMTISAIPYVFFLMFGSAEEQHWNKVLSNPEEQKEKA